MCLCTGGLNELRCLFPNFAPLNTMFFPDYIQFFADKAATKELNRLHVACPSERCSWEGQYCKYIEEHCHSVPCSEGVSSHIVQWCMTYILCTCIACAIYHSINRSKYTWLQALGQACPKYSQVYLVYMCASYALIHCVG